MKTVIIFLILKKIIVIIVEANLLAIQEHNEYISFQLLNLESMNVKRFSR